MNIYIIKAFDSSLHNIKVMFKIIKLSILKVEYNKMFDNSMWIKYNIIQIVESLKQGDQLLSIIFNIIFN